MPAPHLTLVKPRPAPGLFVPGTKYQVFRPLGEGPTGRVYEARRADSPLPFAVKVLHRELCAHPTRLYELLRGNVRRLSPHLPVAHLPDVLELGITADDEVFSATVLRAGRTLRAEMRLRQAMPATDDARVFWAGTVALHVLAGLEIAHRAGVVHGNVTPENIFLKSDGRAMLLDVGVAKCAGEELVGKGDVAASERLLVAARYAAPECLEGGWADARCDVYNLGVVLGELLGGRHRAPPRGVRPDTSISPRAAEVSLLAEAMGGLVRRATERRPGDRYPSAKAFRDELVAALGEPLGDIAPWLVTASGAEVALAAQGWRAAPALAASSPVTSVETERGPPTPSAGLELRPRGLIERSRGARRSLAVAFAASVLGVAGSLSALRMADGASAQGVGAGQRAAERVTSLNAAAPSMAAPSAPERSAEPPPIETSAPTPPLASAQSPTAHLASAGKEPDGLGEPTPAPASSALGHAGETASAAPAGPETAPSVTSTTPPTAVSATKPATRRAKPVASGPSPVKRWIPIEIGGKRIN